MHLILALLLPFFAQAGLDETDREFSKRFLFRDVEFARKVSDYSLITNTALAFTFTAIHQREHRWQKIGGLTLAHVSSFANKIRRGFAASRRGFPLRPWTEE